MAQQLAVITGATGGIGRAIADALCAQGYHLMLVGRRNPELQQLREHLATAYPSVSVYAQRCDLMSDTECSALVDGVLALPHPLGLWVNNAGLSDFGLFEQQTPDQISMLIGVNVTATLLLTRALLGAISPGASLDIVNIGSTFGTIGYPGFAVYSATKFALRGFTEALGREYADSNVRLRYFAPRATRTPLNDSRVEAMNAELGVTMDSPEAVARAFVAFIKGSQVALNVGWPEKFFAWLNRVAPTIVSGALVKQLPTIHRFADGRFPNNSN